MLCAWVMHPDGQGEMGLMGSPRTAIRDPFFWRGQMHVDNRWFALQERFEPHRFDDAPPVELRELILCFEDQLPADPEDVSTDTLETSFAETPFDPNDPDTLPVTHLTHRAFCVVVRLRNT